LWFGFLYRLEVIIMLNRKSVIRAARAMVAGLGIATSSWAAGAATSTVTVTATVPQTCIVSTSNVAFGTYDPVTANSTATGINLLTTGDPNGSVSVTCTKGSTTVDVDLGNGSNLLGTDRQMISGSDLLKYQLYKASTQAPAAACASANIWGSGIAGGTTLTPLTPNWAAGTAKVFNICGFIAKGQDIPPGAYTDAVVATVTY
jgi:spore coat protein U-like protein